MSALEDKPAHLHDRWEGKNIIITGGSRGIGRAVAEAFLKEDARVLLISRTKEELEKTKSELLKIAPRVEIFPADVSELSEIERIEKYIQDAWDDRVYALVNAAGIYGPIGPLDALSEEEMRHWIKTFTINVFGTVFMSRMVIPLMKREGTGRIINLAGGGDGPFPHFTAYNASKGAILRFTESLAAELKNFRIWVNAIAPGAVNTKLLEEVLRAGPEKSGKEFYEKSLKQKEEGGVSAEKAATLILFLCSQEAEGITGKMLSAVWDDIEKIKAHKEEMIQADIYTLRRIKPEDRGYRW